jgi:hypothetical protein
VQDYIKVFQASLEFPTETQKPKTEPKKIYNFGLAMAFRLTAYCMFQRTATLLLVVDWYSQVVGAAVHQYSHLIRNLNPLSPP